MARDRRLSIALGQRLLESKLDVLTGAGGRRPGVALTILTGGAPEPRPLGIGVGENPGPRPARPPGPRRRFTPRTVYLSDRHLRDLDAIVEVLQPAGGRRLTRSAVLRQAIERLRAELSPPHTSGHGQQAAADPSLEHPQHA